jgi:lysyl-tRNA synthetase class 2
MEDMNILMEQRFQKAEQMKEEGLELFQYKYDKEFSIGQILKDYESAGEEESGDLRTAGRLMIKRVHGKTGFADLKDDTGHIQLYFRRDVVGEDPYKLFKKLDIGDIIGVHGTVFRTHSGELTLFVKDFTLLTKSFRPLPEKFHGLQDKELRYRQRYVDMIVHDDVRARFRKRSRIISLIRRTMEEAGYIEVETPVLVQMYGGADARPFTTHHNALNRDLYLRISLETYLKRLMVGGLEKVFEIGRVFRNEGISKRHNPEFTLMEYYAAYQDLYDQMEFTRELILACVDGMGYEDRKVAYGDKTIDFNLPWKTMSMTDAIKEYTGTDVLSSSVDELHRYLKKCNPELDAGKMNQGKLIQEIFEATVEEHLIDPTFITDHPLEISPLAKKKRGDDTGLFVERFELFINGWEMANAFSELNDPQDQEERFKSQEENFRAGDEEAQRLDEDFIRALQYGLPPSGGVGIGIDRLVMLLTDAETIKDVIPFPLLKDEGK